MIAIDTNLLIYAHRAGAAEHAAAKRALERAFNDRRGCGISIPSAAEFWSVVTHKSAAGGASTFEQASKFLLALRDEAGVRFWNPGRGFLQMLVKSAAGESVRGARIFDLQIGLIALENGAEEIWTHDQHFLRIEGLRVHDPLINVG